MFWPHTKTLDIFDKHRKQKAEYRIQNLEYAIIFNSDFWLLTS